MPEKTKAEALRLALEDHKAKHQALERLATDEATIAGTLQVLVLLMRSLNDHAEISYDPALFEATVAEPDGRRKMINDLQLDLLGTVLCLSDLTLQVQGLMETVEEIKAIAAKIEAIEEAWSRG